MSIKYTKQADGTYLKEGEFAAVPAEVLIQIGDGKPFAGSYTLEQATAIIEDAIAKGQVRKDSYAILPVPEKAAKEPKAPRTPKAAKEPKAPRVLKYDVQQFATIYANTKSLDDVCKATGASRAYVHRALVKLGLYEKPAKAVKAAAVLTDADVARVNAIIGAPEGSALDVTTDTVKAAIKQLRKEQRAANKPPKAPKAPRVFKYDVNQFAEIYKATGSVAEVVKATGASPVYAQRALTKLGLYVKPVKAAKAVPAPEPEKATVVTEPEKRPS